MVNKQKLNRKILQILPFAVSLQTLSAIIKRIKTIIKRIKL